MNISQGSTLEQAMKNHLNFALATQARTKQIIHLSFRNDSSHKTAKEFPPPVTPMPNANSWDSKTSSG
jgi:hypothetical protein